LKLLTRPLVTGSSPVKKTIGIFVAICLATRAAGEIRDDCNVSIDKIAKHLWKAGVLTVGPTVFDDEVLAVGITRFLETLQESIYERLVLLWRGAVGEPDRRHAWLLRAGPERPRHRRGAH